MQFRYAVVFDEITGEAHDDIRTLSGAGLIHARDTIEEIKHDEDYRSALVRRGHVWFELQSREASKTFEAIFLTLSTIRSGWKQKHAEIAYRMIQGEKDKTIAKAVGYTQSAIWKRRQKMQIDSYLALRAVLKTLSSRGTLEELNLEAGR
jgi:predicted ATPase